MTPKEYAMPSRTKLQAKQAKQMTQPQPPSGGPGRWSIWIPGGRSPVEDTPLSPLSDEAYQHKQQFRAEKLQPKRVSGRATLSAQVPI